MSRRDKRNIDVEDLFGCEDFVLFVFLHSPDFMAILQIVENVE